jgi:NSS family neurotransmitter:Na+ symporter
LKSVPRLADFTVFGLMDFLSANLLMPMSALLVSVFLGWRMNRLIPEPELSGLSPGTQRLLMFALRYVCPIGIMVVVIMGFVG